MSRKGAASAQGFAETVPAETGLSEIGLSEIGLNMPGDRLRSRRSSRAGGGWILPLVLVAAVLNGFVVLGWLIFGAGDGDGDAAAIPNLAGALPAPSQSFTAGSHPPAEAPETPEAKAPEAGGVSAAPPPAAPALAKDRAVGPGTAVIVEAPAPGKAARRERPGQAAGGAGGGGYRVQLHALGSDAAVRRAWPRLRKTHGDLLGGLSLRVVRAGSGPRQKPFYRMQIGTLASAAAAKKLCDRLKRRKLDCVIVRP